MSGAGTQVAAPPPTASPTASGSLLRRPPWWRRHRFILLATLALVVMAVLSTFSGRSSDRPLAPDNAAPDGARAAAEILRRQGVTVHEATSIAEVTALAGPGATVLVTDLRLVDDERRRRLVDTGADLVLAGSPFTDLEAFEVPLTTSGAGSPRPVAAECTDPDAAAAGEISSTVGSVATDGGGATVCFPVGEAAAGETAGGYAVATDGERTVRYLADPDLITNERLAESGNAALVLRALGHHEDLVWYMPSPFEGGAPAGDPAPSVPSAATSVLWTLGAAALVLALARGRALGRVVTEVMPVVVRSSETTRGRGRLYRRSGDHAHAAAGLRAGAADRLARTLGVPRSAGPSQLVEAVARAARRDSREVTDLLYGPPPTDDAALLALSTRLDALESEVHRP